MLLCCESVVIDVGLYTVVYEFKGLLMWIKLNNNYCKLFWYLRSMWNDRECIYIPHCDDVAGGGDDDVDEMFVCADRLSSDCWGFTLRSSSAPEEDQTDEDSSDVVQKIETFANEINRKWMAPGVYNLALFVLQFAVSKMKLSITKLNCSSPNVAFEFSLFPY